MSVLKAFRNLSSLEYYRNAVRIRKELENYLMHDFFRKVLHSHLISVENEFPPLDKKYISDLYNKYYDKRIFEIETPKDYIDYERSYLINICRDMCQSIVTANSIYISKTAESANLTTRKSYQQRALSDCYRLLEELYEMQEMYPTDLNDLTKIISLLDDEYDLLTGWIKSDKNKLGKT